ncbi:MAG: hypothetical protein LVQ63_07055 [Thermoplasmatales archaeon]|nr:hypothetical protein [Thermoplasmatales archaeon]
MSDDGANGTVKGIGHGATLHTALEWVLRETANGTRLEENDYPNVWNYTMLAEAYAEYMQNPLAPEQALQKFMDKTNDMDKKYGGKKFHRMSREEAWERSYAALLYFTYLGAHQLQKEEQQWSDDELVRTEREESNAR